MSQIIRSITNHWDRLVENIGARSPENAESMGKRKNLCEALIRVRLRRIVIMV